MIRTIELFDFGMSETWRNFTLSYGLFVQGTPFLATSRLLAKLGWSPA